jgi:predicted nucleic acid-binding protein
LITAVDSNILFDVLSGDPARAEESRLALAEAQSSGPVIASEPVFAEVAAHFEEELEFFRFLAGVPLQLQPSTPQSLHVAGQAWRTYQQRRPAGSTCPQCGLSQVVTCARCATSLRPRQHIVADFIIGAHALVQADRLLTRDRGYFASYFPTLTLG